MSLKTPEPSSARKMVHAVTVLLGAVTFTLLCFLILPLTQVIAKKVDADLEVRQASVAEVPPPPPPPEPEPEREEEPEEQPPQLAEEAPPLDLSQIELALNPGAGGGWATGDFGIRLNTQALSGSDGKGVDALFSINDLDQKPRAVYQPSPQRDAKLRKRGAGAVNILFIVDQRGRVENPLVQSSTDATFEPAALAAVKQWRFEPGKRAGQAVRFRMRVPITFPDK
jgi:protein TonB